MSKKFLFVDTDGYQTESEAYESSDYAVVGGLPSANKPALLNAAGIFPSSMFDVGSISHGDLADLSADDHAQYILVNGTRAFSGSQDMGGNLITGLGSPISANDAVRKAYVDAVQTGVKPKGNVSVATTANIALTGLLTIDDYTVASGERVLVKDQTDLTENGIYVAASGAWTRSEDQDNAPLAEIVNGVLIPRVLNGTVNIDKPFFISSVGTGTDGVHIIGTDDIVFDVFTSPTQMQDGEGIAFSGNIINIDLVDSDSGLAFYSGELGVDFSTAYNDAKAIKASDLNSVAIGKGASIIGLHDAAGHTDVTNVEDAVSELYGLIAANGVEYTVAVGGVTKGDLVFVTSNNTAAPYSTLGDAHRGIGLALETKTAGESVKILANDTVLQNVISGGVAGTPYYWDGSNLVSSIPSGSGSHVWLVGVAKNATDLHVEVQFLKRNA